MYFHSEASYGLRLPLLHDTWCLNCQITVVTSRGESCGHVQVDDACGIATPCQQRQLDSRTHTNLVQLKQLSARTFHNIHFYPPITRSFRHRNTGGVSRSHSIYCVTIVTIYISYFIILQSRFFCHIYNFWSQGVSY